MAKLRSRREVLERCAALSTGVRGALGRLPAVDPDQEIVDAIWEAEGLGVLLWALGVVELPPFDTVFERDELLAAKIESAQLRPPGEIEHARQTARLWHWRARTSGLQAKGTVTLPERWESFDQLIAATAMRAYERGLLPRPLRGDFAAYNTVYRDLPADLRAEAESIAWERHRALNWLCGLGSAWDDVPTDT